MSIPDFKSNHDREEFVSIFNSQWHCKKELLDCVKADLFPGYNWDQLQPQTLEVINDMVQSMLYDVDRKFKETHQDYKTEDDDIFIPYRSFKENVTEALKEALTPYELQYKNECPPCDTLACADHLTDE
jgi:hypothetical protein